MYWHIESVRYVQLPTVSNLCMASMGFIFVFDPENGRTPLPTLSPKLKWESRFFLSRSSSAGCQVGVAPPPMPEQGPHPVDPPTPSWWGGGSIPPPGLLVQPCPRGRDPAPNAADVDAFMATSLLADVVIVDQHLVWGCEEVLGSDRLAAESKPTLWVLARGDMS